MKTRIISYALALFSIVIIAVLIVSLSVFKSSNSPASVEAQSIPTPFSTATTTATAMAMTASPTVTPTATPLLNATSTQTMTATPVATATPGTPAGVPPEVAQYASDWPLANKDYSNTRSATNSTINSENVNALGAAWVFNVPSGLSTFGSISTNPIIMGNNVYLQDIGNNIMVLDLETGRQKWQTVYNLTNVGPNGVAVGYGKVFGSAGPYDVVALDENTGEEVWKTTLIDLVSNPSQGVNGIDIQPIVYDGLVYVSTVPGNAGVFYAGGGMGVIYALDQATGEVVWSFNTIQDINIWGHPEINSGGGSWYSPAIDTQTGTIFFSVANPAPFPGQPMAPGIPQDWPNGSSRPGDNLFTNSLMAFDHYTGQLKWYNQVLPHDIKDYDLMIPPILANVSGRDIVITAGKMGVVYAMDRQTGELIWERPVGFHNDNDLLTEFPTDGTVTVYPGILGGVETPMAYADGTVYVLANNLGSDYTNGLTTTLHPFSENNANLLALDAGDGHVIWDKVICHSGGGYGGATVINDLVFTGTFSGMIYAFNRFTGEVVWSYQGPAGVNAWPAVSGDTIVWPLAGAGGAPSIIGFKLGATDPMLKIVSPADNSSAPAGDLQVIVEVNNFKIVDKQGQAAVPGEGHLHYYLDVDAPTTPGQPAIPPSGSTWQTTAEKNFTFTNVAPGTHSVSVELVNNDHTPLNPPLVQKITVMTDNNPRVKISATSPLGSVSNGAVLKSGSIIIHADITNFDVVDKQGQAAVPGEGHLHFYMDVQPPTTSGVPAIPSCGYWDTTADTSYTFQNVPIGLHTFYVQLVNNDHTPLSPNVQASMQIYAITYTGGFGQQ